LPNGSQLSVNQSGTVQIFPLLTLTGVLYVPSFHVNLIFVSKLTTNHNCLTIFQPSISFIIQTLPWRMIGIAERSHNLYQLRISSIHQVSQTKFVTSRLDNESSCLPNKTPNINKSCVDIDNAKLWHFRMGHLSYDRLKILSSYYSNISIGFVHPCDTCHFAKQKRLPLPSSSTKSTQFFYLLHVDIWDPFNHVFVEGCKYFLTVVDYFNRYTWICLMKTKVETCTHLQNFINMI